MAKRPDFGTEPIRCSKRSCKLKGYETEMKQVQHPTISIAKQNVCPACGNDSYYFMTPREIAAWERAKATAPPSSIATETGGENHG
jgi:hypothetical protein